MLGRGCFDPWLVWAKLVSRGVPCKVHERREYHATPRISPLFHRRDSHAPPPPNRFHRSESAVDGAPPCCSLPETSPHHPIPIAQLLRHGMNTYPIFPRLGRFSGPGSLVRKSWGPFRGRRPWNYLRTGKAPQTPLLHPKPYA